MNLQELQLARFLPAFLQRDKTAKGFCYALERQLAKIVSAVSAISLYASLETLDGQVLDALAFQYHIPEYMTDFSVDTKRKLLQGCLHSHQLRGTVAAVEQVIEKIFGFGYVEEWFQYNGQPYRFKVHTSNPSVEDSMVAEFERILGATQNIRSVLEQVVVELSGEETQYAGCFRQEGEIISI